MVTRKEIRIIVDTNGNVVLEPVGAQGGQCLEWTKEIERALGETTERTMKPEFFTDVTEFNGVNDGGS